MHFVWFFMLEGFSHHKSQNPTQVVATGWDSETSGEKSISHKNHIHVTDMRFGSIRHNTPDEINIV